MIVVLTFMSGMDIHTISWGYGWDGSGWVYPGPVGLVHGMQQVRSLCAWFLVWLQVGCL
jgi:hypothetical protein